MARAARKFSRLFLATILLVCGIAMLVLPGPGLVVMAFGLGIVGRELRWAWVLRAERRILNFSRRIRRRFTGGELVPRLG